MQIIENGSIINTKGGKLKMKRFLSMVLVLALCLAFLPVQSAKADTDVNIYEFDFTTLTDKQVEEAYFGTYYADGYGEYYEVREDRWAFLWEDNTEILEWNYKGVVTVDDVELYNGEDWSVKSVKVKALKFESENIVFYIMPQLEESEYGGDTNYLCRVEYDKTTGEKIRSFPLPPRMIGFKTYDHGTFPDDISLSEVLGMVLDGKEIPRIFDYNTGEEITEEVKTEDITTEESKTDDTTEDTTTDDATADTTTEEPKTDDVTTDTSDKQSTTEKTEKKVVKKTSDGREVYEGEQVYIVKKGDCLWNIAEQLLGNGARYRELFTRNNGIVKQARVIFVGQEIIVPAK